LINAESWVGDSCNILLGINQGLTWAVVVMKIDLAGEKTIGLMGLNEFAVILPLD
jgi:hypothetical protein